MVGTSPVLINTPQILNIGKQVELHYNNESNCLKRYQYKWWLLYFWKKNGNFKHCEKWGFVWSILTSKMWKYDVTDTLFYLRMNALGTLYFVPDGGCFCCWLLTDFCCHHSDIVLNSLLSVQIIISGNGSFNRVNIKTAVWLCVPFQWIPADKRAVHISLAERETNDSGGLGTLSSKKPQWKIPLIPAVGHS